VKKLVSNTIAVGLTLACRLSTPISRTRRTKTLKHRHGWLLSLVTTLLVAIISCGLFVAPAIADALLEAHTNRLIQSASPYLLQHAHNPVDWYPWGEEAIAKAKAEDKPIFLCIGYSTCYSLPSERSTPILPSLR